MLQYDGFIGPLMKADIVRFVESCLRCELTKPGPGKGRTRLKQELSGYRNERVAFDIIVMSAISKEGFRYILTIGDYFSKYMIAVPLKTKTAVEVVDAILQHWICRFGCPVTIHCDRAPEFSGIVMRDVFRLLRIYHTNTLPYRPQSDGFVERFNGTLGQMLRSATSIKPINWPKVLPYCLTAYNATPQASTGCTPNMLTYGEEIELPVDIMFGSGYRKGPWINATGAVSYCDYVEHKRSMLIRAFELARKHLRKAAFRQAKGYNVHLKQRQYSVGEWVLRWYKPSLDKPLGRGWVGPFVVTRVLNDVTCEIQTHPKARLHLVHVDHLKHCFAYEGRDNWVLNPNCIPIGPVRAGPSDEADELADILSQEGEDDLDMTALKQDMLRSQSPPRDKPHSISAKSKLARTGLRGGILDRSHPADRIASPDPKTSAIAEGSGQGSTKGAPQRVEIERHPLPRRTLVKTRIGRNVRPPERYGMFSHDAGDIDKPIYAVACIRQKMS